MIVLRLRGGLGNQLFQFAAAKALAEYHKTDLKLDLYYYKSHKYRTFDLGKFEIPFEVASKKEINYFTGKNIFIRALNKRENYLRCPEVFAQPHYHFYADWYKLPSTIYLSGYFQSEKYFLSIREQILKWYSPVEKLDSINQEILNKIKTTESVCLHVRRGDYLNKQFNSFFGTLPDSYYRQGLTCMTESIHNPVFYVFSDDIEWCKLNLKIPNASYVDCNQGLNSYKDLVLMSKCKHNLIANSSFSWWGAWLNSNPSKQVIAPATWFNQEYFSGKECVYPCRYYNTCDLIPDTWTRL